MQNRGKGYICFNLFLILLQAHVGTFLNIDIDVEKVKFYLYPRQGDPSFREEIKYTDEVSLARSSFKRGGLTVFIIHGFAQNPDTPRFKIITDAYINSPFGGNYIAVDWRNLAGIPEIPGDRLLLYPIAFENVPRVARRVANFLDWLRYTGALNINNVHIVGHSMGAHLAGEAGDMIKNALGGQKLARITGLDPAGPLYSIPHKSRNINKHDAQFVDIIHTNQGDLGETRLSGHVDFVVNDGSTQPGCNFFADPFDGCSHNFAEKVYAGSFLVPFYGCQCSQRELDHYNFQICMSQCPNRVSAGVYTPQTARGEYTVITGRL